MSKFQISGNFFADFLFSIFESTSAAKQLFLDKILNLSQVFFFVTWVSKLRCDVTWLYFYFAEIKMSSKKRKLEETKNESEPEFKKVATETFSKTNGSVNLKRIFTHCSGTIQKGATIIYWMSRDQRVEDNWALLYAQELAKKHESNFAVVFCLVTTFMNAPYRHFAFMLKGLQEVEQDLQSVRKKRISWKFETPVFSHMLRKTFRSYSWTESRNLNYRNLFMPKKSEQLLLIFLHWGSVESGRKRY